MSVEDLLFIIMMSLGAILIAWHAEDRERALNERITVLEMENAGLEARVTKEALRAYCRVECGSCISRELLIAALTGERYYE